MGITIELPDREVLDVLEARKSGKALFSREMARLGPGRPTAIERVPTKTLSDFAEDFDAREKRNPLSVHNPYNVCSLSWEYESHGIRTAGPFFFAEIEAELLRRKLGYLALEGRG